MKKLLYVRLIVITTSFFISAAVFAQSSKEDVAALGKPATSVTYNANADALALASVKSTRNPGYADSTPERMDSSS